MKWNVFFSPIFEPEFDELDKVVKEELLAHAKLLKEFGPQLGRPIVDTLKDSAFSNMKEIRFNAGNGVWRVAFAFDPARQAILLIAGNKKGKDQKRFYKDLIRIADERYEEHLKVLKGVSDE
jgi:hypothetical protein